MQEVPRSERLVVAGDVNGRSGRIEQNMRTTMEIMESERCKSALDMATAYQLRILNTIFHPDLRHALIAYTHIIVSITFIVAYDSSNQHFLVTAFSEGNGIEQCTRK